MSNNCEICGRIFEVMVTKRGCVHCGTEAVNRPVEPTSYCGYFDTSVFGIIAILETGIVITAALIALPLFLVGKVALFCRFKPAIFCDPKEPFPKMKVAPPPPPPKRKHG